MTFSGKVLNLEPVEGFVCKIQHSYSTFKDLEYMFYYINDHLLNLKTTEKISDETEVQLFKIHTEKTSIGSNVYAPIKDCFNFLSENIDELVLSQEEILSFVSFNKQKILSWDCNKVNFISKSEGNHIIISVWRNKNFDLVAGSGTLEYCGVSTVYSDELFNYLVVKKINK